ncbi:hypothetical protein MRB53_041138 [Persea americana]|nr:hypothetical protein MRB53_041138 [Persea americana]
MYSIHKARSYAYADAFYFDHAEHFSVTSFIYMTLTHIGQTCFTGFGLIYFSSCRVLGVIAKKRHYRTNNGPRHSPVQLSPRKAYRNHLRASFLAPSTIGGAVNLTPKALRYLDYLGVYSLFLSREQGAECRKIDLLDLYTGSKYAEVDFEGTTGRGMGHTEEQRFVARRVRRAEIQEALLEKCRAVKGIEVVFGQAVEQITETEDGVTLRFKDDRKPKYTGVATAMACIDLRAWYKDSMADDCTHHIQTRKFDGQLLRLLEDKQYIAAVMETKEVADKEGWRVRGAAQESMKKDIQERFQSPEVVFTAYEQLRREHVEAAYKLAASRWENVKDCGWFAYKMRVWMTPWILWWTANAREIEFAEDLVQSLKDK